VRIHGHSKPLVLVALCLGQFMIQLDITIVNVALPSIGHDLHTSLSGLQWIVDGYSLALAGLLLTGGRVGDRIGHRRVYLTGLIVFGVASALCALAPSAGWLVCFRIGQGIGGAIQLPATLALLTHTFTDPRQRAQAVGIWSGAAGSALIVGPLLGGGLIAAFGWRAVFVVNLPIALAAVGLTLAAITGSAPSAGGGLDLSGQVLGAAALSLLAGGAIEGGHLGLASPAALGLFAAGILCLIGFLLVEDRGKNPMLPLSFFRSAAYSAAHIAAVVMGFVTIGLLFIFSLFFQQVQGDSAISAGVRFVPFTVAFVICGPLVGRVINRSGHRMPMTIGCLLMAIGCLLLLRVGPHTGYLVVAGPFVLIGIGYGLLSTPMAAAVMGAVPRARAGMASSTNLTGRITGGVFGIAVLGALLPAETAHFTAGLRSALGVAAVVALAGAVVTAVFIRQTPKPGKDDEHGHTITAAQDQALELTATSTGSRPDRYRRD
jgi:DHA2 family methylenomycin A resistance protein-like MFS transporter